MNMAYSTLISRVDTTNAGNQLLTTQLQALLARVLEGDVVLVERHPAFLQKFSAAHVPVADLPRRIESWADEVVTAARGSLKAPEQAPRGKGLRSKTSLEKWAFLRRQLLPITQKLHIKGMLAKLGYYDDSIVPRLSLYVGSQWVVANPAGDIQADSLGTATRQFLDALIAKKLGARVALVNHSIESHDERLKAIIRHVYPQLDLVLVRDTITLDFLRDIGVDCGNVMVVPDAAILFTPAQDLTLDSALRKIGFSINAKFGRHLFEDWVKLVQGMADEGHVVRFVTNDFATDIDFARALAKRVPLEIQDGPLDFAGYCHEMAKLKVVITNRLHTVVMATISGVQSVPIEAGAFKIRGSVDCLDLPLKALNTLDSGWFEATQRAVAEACAHQDENRVALLQAAAAARQRIEQAYRSILSPRQNQAA
jgi:polysaccharide pyruvyl transferase WcaK-like protein